MSLVSDPNFKIIADRLKSEFQPVRLFLYGSRSNNTHRPDSNYGFVMVLKEFDSKNRYDLQIKIRDMFYADGIDVKVWTCSIEQFDDWKDEFSSVPHQAHTEGIEFF